MKVFLHGVPDTPFMWTPLLEALDLPPSDVLTPALPGFGCARPRGFAATKEAYAAWLIGVLETTCEKAGHPVDVVGHDWGSLLMARVVAQRPDLIRSWVLSNALPDPAYRWHSAARGWQTPLLGELMMAATRLSSLEKPLRDAAMPARVAAHEAGMVDVTMRQCILALYRSAKTVGEEWAGPDVAMPGRGLVFWGDADPFVDVAVAERFCARHGMPLHREASAGHWALIERPEAAAAVLRAHWA